jgi:hypothetical protein
VSQPTARAVPSFSRLAPVRTKQGRPHGTIAECAPWNGRVRFAAAERYRARTASASPELGSFLLGGRYRVLAQLGHSPFQNSWLLKLSLMVSADCEPTSASRIRSSSESFTMDCDHSKRNETLFGMYDWPDCLRGQAGSLARGFLRVHWNGGLGDFLQGMENQK